MLTKKVFDIKGQSQIQVQEMDTATPHKIILRCRRGLRSSK
jgi:hypothetical protein